MKVRWYRQYTNYLGFYASWHFELFVTEKQVAYLQQWCNDNFKIFTQVCYNGYIYFYDENDAAMFLLVWDNTEINDIPELN